MFDSELENRLYLSSCVAIEERMTYLEQDNILYTGVYLSFIVTLETTTSVLLTGTQVLQWPL